MTDVLAAFDADAGFPSLPIDNVLVTYVPPVIDAGTGQPVDPTGFFVQAAPDGPALFVGVSDAGVRAGDLVSFTATSGSRLFGLRQVTSYTGFSRSSSNNPVSGYVRDVSAVDFTQNFDAWESRLIRIVGTPQGLSTAAGNGFKAISLGTAGVPDGGSTLRLRLPSAYLDQQDLSSACQVVVTGTPLWRFQSTAQPLAFSDSELMGTSCPAPNLISAFAPGPQTVAATFDRALSPSTVQPQFFTLDAGAGQLGPAVQSATLYNPRVVVLQTGLLSQRPYELSCTTGVTDLRGRPVATRTQPFVVAPPPASCSPVVISQVYPTGGNTGAVYNVDFIELRNRSLSPVSLAGWTLQYQSSTSSQWSTLATLFNTMPANSFLLITTGPTGSGAPLVGDVSATQALAGAAAKVALVPYVFPLAAGCPDAGFADLVGYGTQTSPCAEGMPAAAPTAATSISRGPDGCIDNNSNFSDFSSTLPPTPRSSSFDGGSPCGTCN